MPDHAPELLEDLGRKVAELDGALTGFDHPAIHRHLYWDLARGLPIVRELAPRVEDADAVVTTPEIAASFDNGMEFFSTFGGSTVSCVVGLAVLDVVSEERLQEHAHEVGAGLLDALRQLGGRHPLVGDVRGSGLFLGVELVKDRETLEPATAEAAAVVNRMRERGFLLGTDGPFANVLKIRPPMPFTRENAADLAATLDEVLGR